MLYIYCNDSNIKKEHKLLVLTFSHVTLLNKLKDFTSEDLMHHFIILFFFSFHSLIFSKREGGKEELLTWKVKRIPISINYFLRDCFF